MADERTLPQVLTPFFPPDLRSITSLAGLQEIAKTYQQVMERNDRAVDELFDDPKMETPLEEAFRRDPANEASHLSKIFHRLLLGHLRKIVAFMNGLGVPMDVDLAAAERSLSACGAAVMQLRASYNRWRLDQSNLVAAKLREAIDVLSRRASD